MSGQMRLEGTDVPVVVGRIRPATVALGRRGIAENRAILASKNRLTETK